MNSIYNLAPIVVPYGSKIAAPIYADFPGTAPNCVKLLREHQFSGWFIPKEYRWKIQNTNFHQEVMLISPEKHFEFLELEIIQETSSGECSFV